MKPQMKSGEPTPLHIETVSDGEGELRICTEDSILVAIVPDVAEREYAELIVRAVNAHDELVKALRDIQELANVKAVDSIFVRCVRALAAAGEAMSRVNERLDERGELLAERAALLAERDAMREALKKMVVCANCKYCKAIAEAALAAKPEPVEPAKEGR